MSFRKEHALGPIALRGLEPELAGIEIHILDVEYDARAEPDARREQQVNEREDAFRLEATAGA